MVEQTGRPGPTSGGSAWLRELLLIGAFFALKFGALRLLFGDL